MRAGYIAPVQRPHTIRFQFDQRVTARATLTRILWLQGFPDQAMRTAQRDVEDALAIDHALSLCNALADGACPVALFIGDLDAAERSVTMLIDHSGKHALSTWLALGHICEAVLLIKRDDAVTGLPLLRAALNELRETGYLHGYPESLGTLAEALGPAGQVKQGLVAIDEALVRSERTKHAGAWPSCCASKVTLFCRRLYESLQDQRAKAEAAEIYQVMLVPDEDDLAIVLRGDLPAMLSFAAAKRMPGFLSEAGLLGDLVSPVSVVAGAYNRRSLGLPDRVAGTNSLRSLAPGGLFAITGLPVATKAA